MHVICKSCNHQIPVAGRPKGSTSLTNVRASGNVRIGDGRISFGPGGKISFGKGGGIGFGRPRPSTFMCPKCGNSHEYASDEIKD
jgi:predicted RNA-binding Zn-ribbon protein involved in translation (DUF1610 family)